MARLIFVRHARPEIVPGQPASSWPLSSDGRIAAAGLARRLAEFAPASIVASTEPKASGTAAAIAQALGLPMEVDAGLIEHRRETVPFREAAAHEALVVQMFREPSRLVLGEETADEAHARFAEAVERAPMPGVAVIVSHGTVMTLWLSRRFGVDPVGLWRELSMPCAAVLSPGGESFRLVA